MKYFYAYSFTENERHTSYAESYKNAVKNTNDYATIDPSGLFPLLEIYWWLLFAAFHAGI